MRADPKKEKAIKVEKPKEQKQKSCRICTDKFTPFNTTDVICAKYDCRVTYALIIVEKNRKAKEKQVKKDNIAEKKKLREATTNYKNKLQLKVQKIARLIDKDLPCLARGIFGKMAGGHVFAKGGHAQMRFNLHNIHRQCFMSNGKSSDDGLLREMLEKEYGSEYWNFVKWLRIGDVPKLKDWEYRETYFNALKLIKTLETENRTYNLAERIELRNQVNLELGIYQPDFCVFDLTPKIRKKAG